MTDVHMFYRLMDQSRVFIRFACLRPGKSAGQGSWGASLRSLYGHESAKEGTAADVSKIAGLYGGGGHRAASGMGAKVRDLEDLFVQ